MTEQPKNPPEQVASRLTFSEVCNNYTLLTNVLHTISKLPSSTDEEFELKFNVQDTMRNKAHRYGKLLQFGILGSLIIFCLKSNRIKTKVGLGLLYMYWGTHFYTLGSHAGMLLYTPWAIKQLDMGAKYETGRIMEKFLKKLKSRQEAINKGEIVPNDDKFQQEFILELSGSTMKKPITRSYVASDYFDKHYEKYLKKSPEDSNDPNKIFVPEIETSDKLKVPYLPEKLDCFLTRYMYHSFARWTHRVLLYIGVRSEQQSDSTSNT